MPISRMIPISAITAEIVAGEHNSQDRTHAGGRERRENRDGVNVAFVQNSQNDVHRDNRGKNQEGLAASESKCGRSPSKCGVNTGGNWISFSARSMALVASPKNAPGARLNESVTTGNCPDAPRRVKRGSIACEQTWKAERDFRWRLPWRRSRWAPRSSNCAAGAHVDIVDRVRSFGETGQRPPARHGTDSTG